MENQRAEAERWVGIASKLLSARDFIGSKTFAIRAREADPTNVVADQILAIVDTVIAGEKRVNANEQAVPDWYSILQLPRFARDADVIAESYKRIMGFLNPDRNRFPFVDYALQLVMDAWNVLGDSNRKWVFDNQLLLWLQHQPQPQSGSGAPSLVVQQQQQNNDVVVGKQQQQQNNIVASAAAGGDPSVIAKQQQNTFQFFQPQQQMQQQQHSNHHQQQQQQQQINFMQLQSQHKSMQQQQQQQDQIQPQQQQSNQLQQINFMQLQSQHKSMQQRDQMQPQQQMCQQQPQQQQLNQIQPQQQEMWHHQPQSNQLQQQQQQQQQQINLMELQSQQKSMQQKQQQGNLPQWQMRDPTPSKGGGGGGSGSGSGSGSGRERNAEMLNGIGVNTGVTSTDSASPVTPSKGGGGRGSDGGGEKSTGMLNGIGVNRELTSRGTVTAPLGNRGRGDDGGGGGEGNARMLDGIGGVNRGITVTANPVTPTMQQVPEVTVQAPLSSMDGVTRRTTTVEVVDNVSGIATVNTNVDVENNIRVNNDNGDCDDLIGVKSDIDDEDVVEEVDSFWTACPYCLYIFEYLKMYQDSTLRCHICRRGFHAVQIRNPPLTSYGDDGGEKDKEKEDKKSFCCWSFFPLGFSMTAWRKHIQNNNLNGSSNWVPFSPMFNCPVEDGGGGFKWFDNTGGNAFVGPSGQKKSNKNKKNDKWKDFSDVSESSHYDSSDGEWKTPYTYTNMNKMDKRKTRSFTYVEPKGVRQSGISSRPVTRSVARELRGSVGGEDKDDGSDKGKGVLGLAAEDEINARKTVSAAPTRKILRRSARLDLNVKFNNDGEEHAPTASAVNGAEDAIENIAFFDGLDEFLSTLPI